MLQNKVMGNKILNEDNLRNIISNIIREQFEREDQFESHLRMQYTEAREIMLEYEQLLENYPRFKKMLKEVFAKDFGITYTNESYNEWGDHVYQLILGGIQIDFNTLSMCPYVNYKDDGYNFNNPKDVREYIRFNLGDNIKEALNSYIKSTRFIIEGISFRFNSDTDIICEIEVGF